MAWKRDNLRVALYSVRSIEDSGLASPFEDGLPFVTPHDPLRKSTSMPAETFLQALASPGVGVGGPSPSPGETYSDAMESLPKHKSSRKEVGARKRTIRRRNSGLDEDSLGGNDVGGDESLGLLGGQEGSEKRRDSRPIRNFLASRRISLAGIDEGDDTGDSEIADSLDGKLVYSSKLEGQEDSGQSSGKAPETRGFMSAKQNSYESKGDPTSPSSERNEFYGKVGLKAKPDVGVNSNDLIGNLRPAVPGSGDVDAMQADRGEQARSRWRRLKHTVSFANHMSATVKSPTSTNGPGEGEQTAGKLNGAGEGTGKPSAAAGAGTKGRSEAQLRAKGRKGMEGMLVRQNRGIMCLVQDFYVACLKLPIGQFFAGVFLSPLALGLLFTPIYLLGMGGLSTEAVDTGEQPVNQISKAMQTLYTVLHVFIYALSLSTTFGGSPVAALSPFTLFVANVHTLMGQFLFVFLSGAVFARMSQPSHPIRCCKTAIIKADDFGALSPSEQPKERNKVFAVRLVLTGPPPCELVDAKICLVFRIFIKLPSGSMFCSTQDLSLVRPEVSFLRYGIMVRHVIDKKSPLHGHTMETLLDGDASFSLTIMAQERASMQSIFHLEEYYVCDGDVAWDADFVDFIHVNKRGHRVLDHSRLDLLKVTDATKMAGSWKKKILAAQGKKEREKTPPSDDQSISSDDQPIIKGVVKGAPLISEKTRPFHAKSQSFIRASI